MKKIIIALVVLVFAAPAWADVIITAAQVLDTNEVVISFDASGEGNFIRAFSLNLQLDDEATILGVGNVNADYYIHPGTIVIDTTGPEVQIDYGTPVAEYDDLQSDTLLGLDSNGITIEMGSLYAATDPCHTTAPLKSGVLLSIYLSKPADLQTCLTITGNVARAGSNGVVMEDPDELVVVDATGCCAEFPSDECFSSSHPDYLEWRDVVGKPNSWCYKYQCYGDADGMRNGSPFTGYSRVRVDDFNVLISGWKVAGYVDEATHPWIAADFDRTLNGSPFTGYSRIRVEDLTILVANWKSDAGIPMTTPNCGGDIDLTPP